MPLEYYRHFRHNTEIGIWKQEENLQYFREHVDLFEVERKEIADLSRRKLMEWYTSRYLLHIMSGRKKRGACLKDEYGKPYLTGSDYHISVSHSADRTAVIASPSVVGVDIQIMVEKITRIAGKFCNQGELDFIPPDDRILYLHFIWGAKECIYKAYGKRGVDFKKHMMVDAFTLENDKIKTSGRIIMENLHMEFEIRGEIIDEFILTYAIEKHN